MPKKLTVDEEFEDEGDPTDVPTGPTRHWNPPTTGPRNDEPPPSAKEPVHWTGEPAVIQRPKNEPVAKNERFIPDDLTQETSN